MKKSLGIVAGVIAGLILLSMAGWRIYTRSQIDSVHEAVVRFIVKDSGTSSNPGGHNLFFVSIWHQDPPADFPDRFKGSGFEVRPASRSRPTGSPFTGHVTVDASTGEKGVEVLLNRDQWMGPQKVLVFCGGDIYSVVKGEYQWEVQEHMIIG